MDGKGIDLSKLSPAPWDCENVEDRGQRSAHAIVSDATGGILFDTLNSDVAEIHEEPDEGRTYYYERQGLTDLGFAALARNAFDVMMRRRWGVLPCHAADGWWVCNSSEGTPFDGNCPAGKGCPTLYWPDPLTALVEADKWYKENVEAKRP